MRKKNSFKFLDIPCPWFLEPEEFEIVKDFFVTHNVQVCENVRLRNCGRVTGFFDFFVIWCLKNHSVYLPVDIYRFYACVKMFGGVFVHEKVINLQIPRPTMDCDTTRCFYNGQLPYKFETHINNIINGEYRIVETSKQYKQKAKTKQ